MSFSVYGGGTCMVWPCSAEGPAWRSLTPFNWSCLLISLAHPGLAQPNVPVENPTCSLTHSPVALTDSKYD